MGFVLGDTLGTKPCVFPCEVAPAGDERYLGSAAVAAGVVCVFSVRNGCMKVAIVIFQ